jgi:hypothetical protein
LGSHERRLPLGVVALGLLVFLSACGDDEEPVILPSDYQPAAGGEEIPDAVDDAPPEPRLSTVVVKSAQPFLEESFLTEFIRRQPRAVDRAFLLFKDMVAFPDSDGSEPDLDFTPSAVKTMRQEFVAVVQRAKSRGKRRFVEDLEIFAVFNAAFETMSAGERDDLLSRWRESIGSKEPSRPVTSYYPLYWIRESLPLWTGGGSRWWWGWHALAKDPAFEYSPEDGAWYTAPDGTLFVSRKP